MRSVRLCPTQIALGRSADGPPRGGADAVALATRFFGALACHTHRVLAVLIDEQTSDDPDLERVHVRRTLTAVVGRLVQYRARSTRFETGRRSVPKRRDKT